MPKPAQGWPGTQEARCPQKNVKARRNREHCPPHGAARTGAPFWKPGGGSGCKRSSSSRWPTTVPSTLRRTASAVSRRHDGYSATRSLPGAGWRTSKRRSAGWQQEASDAASSVSRRSRRDCSARSPRPGTALAVPPPGPAWPDGLPLRPGAADDGIAHKIESLHLAVTSSSGPELERAAATRRALGQAVVADGLHAVASAALAAASDRDCLLGPDTGRPGSPLGLHRVSARCAAGPGGLKVAAP
jgi:hypothetical protein